MLRRLPGVDDVEAADARMTPIGAELAAAFVVASTAGPAVRTAVAAAVVGHGWGLLELRPVAMSLEDLFVRLVTREPATSAEVRP